MTYQVWVELGPNASVIRGAKLHSLLEVSRPCSFVADRMHKCECIVCLCVVGFQLYCFLIVLDRQFLVEPLVNRHIAERPI